jgi:hypothetical protein
VKGLLLLVPDGDGEHPDEALHGGGDAPLLECGQHHFGVGPAAEAMAEAFQFGAEAGVVVDLAVEDHHEAAAGREHRLVALGRQVEDRQAPESEAHAQGAVRPRPFVVGAAVLQAVRHALGEGVEFRLVCRCLPEAGDAAHTRSGLIRSANRTPPETSRAASAFLRAPLAPTAGRAPRISRPSSAG